MKISKQLDHSLFYTETKTPKDFFPNENEFYLSGQGTKPWLADKIDDESIIAEWHVVKEKLERFFAIRNTESTTPLMIQGISLFIRFLFWSNHKPVCLESLTNQLATLKIKPININDRLQYILKRPNTFHSFIQLSELFVEQEKVYYRHLVMKKE